MLTAMCLIMTGLNSIFNEVNEMTGLNSIFNEVNETVKWVECGRILDSCACQINRERPSGQFNVMRY